MLSVMPIQAFSAVLTVSGAGFNGHTDRYTHEWLSLSGFNVIFDGDVEEYIDPNDFTGFRIFRNGVPLEVEVRFSSIEVHWFFGNTIVSFVFSDGTENIVFDEDGRYVGWFWFQGEFHSISMRDIGDPTTFPPQQPLPIPPLQPRPPINERNEIVTLENIQTSMTLRFSFAAPLFVDGFSYFFIAAYENSKFLTTLARGRFKSSISDIGWSGFGVSLSMLGNIPDETTEIRVFLWSDTMNPRILPFIIN